MQYLFQGRPTEAVRRDPPPDLMDKVRGDWATSREYYAQGVIRQMWTSGIGVYAICEAESREQLEALFSAMPMAAANLIEFEIFELKPYRGFAPEPA